MNTLSDLSHPVNRSSRLGPAGSDRPQEAEGIGQPRHRPGGLRIELDRPLSAARRRRPVRQPGHFLAGIAAGAAAGAGLSEFQMSRMIIHFPFAFR